MINNVVLVSGAQHSDSVIRTLVSIPAPCLVSPLSEDEVLAGQAPGETCKLRKWATNK